MICTQDCELQVRNLLSSSFPEPSRLSKWQYLRNMHHIAYTCISSDLHIFVYITLICHAKSSSSGVIYDKARRIIYAAELSIA